jgi:hypothetical protein
MARMLISGLRAEDILECFRLSGSGCIPVVPQLSRSSSLIAYSAESQINTRFGVTSGAISGSAVLHRPTSRSSPTFPALSSVLFFLPSLHHNTTPYQLLCNWNFQAAASFQQSSSCYSQYNPHCISCRYKALSQTQSSSLLCKFKLKLKLKLPPLLLLQQPQQ